MRKIRKAVIPAAGLGTRFLPATKAQPKEMLPIVDKPTIQYIVEEAIKSGIEDIVIVTGRNKRAIEDHFDRSMELEAYLEKNAKDELLDLVQDIAQLADIYYVRQKEALGLGHAIYSARKFIGNEPFAVLLGDDVIHSKVPALRQMMNQYERYGASIVGVQEVPLEDTSKYGIVDGEKFADRLYRSKDMVEKPRSEDAPKTHLAIMGRYILNPEIFDILSVLPSGKGGEIQLTDGIKELGRYQEILAYEFEGRRYDVGDKLGFVEATIDYALRREYLAEDLMNYLRTLVRKFDI
ncbi:UTP--glucose-1-phosphate uridylyltransferase GalU [Desulfosporosinus sp. BICA1-9]|uniref:UTP--glucose-1-phosphate uridylyltransferase GalU n=1 Tax=Desulfosporosinus sp. BICA1-9 TaxID=1531958 RepID=UPI00054B6E82|nr:UTP--glucose-1-phosphate uridylyltransferase GalU [Desulfosporosinus sp. BICA1-9]KJS46503.1 MAG: UTP--glucose-1-phosphate uridylyltransferase [Peptococcaceae bacterium BRH_c23]KJS78875.1 MAG: UTP--glucose-1-phosphate uridylyltransferase [Desulfosporosinus sp. BICA1-9]HBW38884.1 UTP--glucose-1-phosphate uridylyltransferase [Desulfosporosinus sp.]